MLLLSPQTGRKLISGLIFLFFLTGNAQAQVIHAIQVQGEDDWTLNAAVLNGHVIGFLATHDPSTIPTGSFANIWFERQSDNSFTAAGNVADSPTAVAARIELNKSAALFEQNELRDPSDPSAVTLTQFFIGPSDVTLTPMNKGLAEDDSFQSIVDQLNPEQMEFIVWQGAQGAVSLSAMTIAVNTCQLDPTDGTSAHGVSLLTNRLLSHADYFDQLLALSEEDWSGIQSGNSTIPAFVSQQNCADCEEEDATVELYYPPHCDDAYRNIKGVCLQPQTPRTSVGHWHKKRNCDWVMVGTPTIVSHPPPKLVLVDDSLCPPISDFP
jgi:hypothetical protein